MESQLLTKGASCEREAESHLHPRPRRRGPNMQLKEALRFSLFFTYLSPGTPPTPLSRSLSRSVSAGGDLTLRLSKL